MRRIELVILSGFGENGLSPARHAVIEDGVLSYPDKDELEALREMVLFLTPVKAYFTVNFNHTQVTLAWEVPEVKAPHQNYDHVYNRLLQQEGNTFVEVPEPLGTDTPLALQAARKRKAALERKEDELAERDAQDADAVWKFQYPGHGVPW